MSIDIPGMSLVKVPFKYGLISGFIFCIQINIQHLFRGSFPELLSTSSYLSLPVLFLLTYLALSEKSRLYEGSSTYSVGLQTSLLTTLFAALTSCFFMFVYNEYINNDLVDIMRERFTGDLLAQDVSPEELNTFLKEMLQPYSTKWLLKTQFVVTLLAGALFSAIAPVIAKTLRKRKNRSSAF